MNPDLEAVRASIDASLAQGDHEAARDALLPVAHALALTDGGGFRLLVQSIPEHLWHDDVVINAALGSSYRSAGSPPGSAALAYFRAAEFAIAKAPAAVDPGVVASVLTAHAVALRIQGRLDAAVTKLTEAGRVLDEEAHGSRYVQHSARYSLELGVVELVLGRLDSARHRLEYACGLAEAHLTLPERAEAVGTLALAAYAQGDLPNTDLLLASMSSLELPGSIRMSGFCSAAYAADILVTTDRHGKERLPALVESIVEASANTEWEPFASVVSAYSHALAREPIAALDLLHQAHQRYMGWNPHSIGMDIGDLLRADILSGLDRGDEAFEILAELNPHERHALCPERFMARICLQHGDLKGADQALSDCELLGVGHSPRTLIDVQLLRGAIEMERGELTLSDVSVDRAIHAMARTGVRSPFRHIPPALLARMARRALQRPQSDEVRRILSRVVEATDGHTNDRDPLSERERLVLVYVERKLTVAQIAAELYISPNTVKTHLRRLYSKLGVSTREEAIRKARSLGLHIGSALEITRESPADPDAGQDDAVL